MTIRRLVDKSSGLACALILIGFGIAGLSPFHAPVNGVQWIGKGKGLRLQGEGVLWSEQPLSSDGAMQDRCSIELWFQAARNIGLSTIVDFYQPDAKKELIIRQDGNSRLEIIRSDPSGMHVIEGEHTFFPGNRTLLTITSGAGGTRVFLDAAEVRSLGNLALSGADCAGQLVLGEAAVSYSNWNGDFYGFAVRRASLSDLQVQQDFDAWRTQGHLKPDASPDVVASFDFREQGGGIVHNQIESGPDLIIPSSFQIPGRHFLDSPWDEFRSGGIRWKDVLINVAGFFPFGFFLYPFISSIQKIRQTGFVVIAIGVCVSLTIEMLQWYLPTRDSSMTDVITNTSGTVMGVLAYRLLFGKFHTLNS